MSKTTPVQAQFGLWESPITPASLGRSSGLSDAAWDHSGALVWLENRPDRSALVVQEMDGQAPRDLNSSFSARGRVGYGGGAFTVGHGQVLFTDAASGRIYRQALRAGLPQPLTPAFGAAAAPCLSPNGEQVLFVHTYEEQDCLAWTAVQGPGWPVKLASGHDFYMQPAWHPDGKQVAFIAWDHPQMPWDGTLLYLARLAHDPGGASLQDSTVIAGGNEISIYQPGFSPDGRSLAYISDETGWWQLYLYDLQNKQHRQLTSAAAEHGQPAWNQGLRSYGFSPDGQVIYFVRSQNGVDSLWQLALDHGKETRIDLDVPYQSLAQPSVSPDGSRLALIASAAHIPARLITVDLQGRSRVLKRTSAEELELQAYSLPQSITWLGMDNEPVYGLLYSPQNPRYTGKGRPPLVVFVHGGPTGQRTASFSPSTQFFTSRGYAVLEVNYRGSTGYGRAYRNKLRLSWGIYDVQDSVSGARSLVERGLVDGSKLVILGGSAGGFTVLKALEDYPGFFKAGVCLYGIANHFTALDTHKFEAHYSDTLLGVLPEAAEVYRQRSPIFYVDQIRDPIALFQGEDDVVVRR
ncbi:MAG: prolyl oligopeptidase family serine peptidase, partial [Anaerolineales bacterium]|nr:prolyl oligopeptidase family serine peptidase [Anaerolineales bacterium]